ncbi:acyl-CoA dehydrogenase family protein [Kocuria sp. M1R5S2]|uniref:acyl-CoA dehydrogenase family protein n=1 Tax=Kocuria rhizosphaerae TaxID=3376285 RepID=UPI0037A75764
MTAVLPGQPPTVEPVAGLPLPDADLFSFAELLPPPERERLAALHAFLQAQVRPVVTDFWNRAELPLHLLPALAEHGLGELELSGAGRLFRGLAYAEVARADVSLSALVGIHNELVLGLIDALGSAEQKSRWLPDLRRFRALGAFALTEPDHGSDIAGGLATTALRDGDSWVLSGRKRWIGSGTVADVAIVWARDTADGQIKAFLVETGVPGWSATRIEHKMGLRIMQNADIVLDDVRIPASAALPGAQSFAAANEMLRNSRAWVGWQAAGVQLAIFDVARDYVLARRQFGRPLAAFQLVQEPLARILGNATASLGLMAQLARLQEAGTFGMSHAALAKATTTSLARESASLGRGLLGGNGVVTDHEMAKLFNDVEILYTYEGTYEINALIVGRAVTGVSAFV